MWVHVLQLSDRIPFFFFFISGLTGIHLQPYSNGMLFESFYVLMSGLQASTCKDRLRR